MRRKFVALVCFIVGVLAASRPFWNVGDPAVEPIDKLLAPFYNLAPLFPNVPGTGDALFIWFVYAANGILYGLVAWGFFEFQRRRNDSISAKLLEKK